MAKACVSCGKSIDDAATFCDGCGAAQPVAAPGAAQGAAPGATPFTSAAAEADEVFDPADIEKNKVMAGLAYILFFLPLVACPESRFGRFHANQGLILLLISIVGGIVLGIIPIIGWIIMPIFYIAVMVLAIMGLVAGLNGQAKKLPLIGKLQFKIIK